jgi:broad specificity phosphatase PhoE
VDSNVQTVVLVRHGRSTANDDPRIYRTTPDHAIPLADPDGDPDVLAAGARVATLGLPPAELCSWRSTYLRCAQTEALVLERAFGAARAEVARRESYLLREQEFGDWDGLTEVEMQARDPERYARRARMSDHLGRFYFRYPSGESRADVVQRIATFLGKLHRSRFPHHIVFLHGVTQRAFRMAWCNRAVEWFELEPNPRNASVLLLRRDVGQSWCDGYLD